MMLTIEWNLGEVVKAWLRQQRVYEIVLWSTLPKRIKGYLDVEQHTSYFSFLLETSLIKKRSKNYKWS